MNPRSNALQLVPDQPVESSATDLVHELLPLARRAARALSAAEVRPDGSVLGDELTAEAAEVLDRLRVALVESSPSRRALVVARDGSWYEYQGTRFPLSRRGAVRRIFERLVQLHRTAPGRPMTNDDTFAVGWPGESATHEAGLRRVYTAMWTLRTLGLSTVLITRHDGYLLDPNHHVRQVDERL